MKAVAFDYVRPTSIGAAVRNLVEGGAGAKVIAGGQSLGPMLNMRLVRPTLLVDIADLAELRRKSVEADRFVIGAAITHAEIEDGVLGVAGVHLQRVAAGIAYRAVRNRGTIGGSLVHADPAGDWLVALVALGAAVRCVGSAGARTMSLDSFVVGAFSSALGDAEIVTAIEAPRASPAARFAYQKFCRKPGEFADASCAAFLDPAHGVARVALGALGGAPRLMCDLGARIAEDGVTAATDEAIAAAVADATPGRDAADRLLYATLVRRSIERLAAA